MSVWTVDMSYRVHGERAHRGRGGTRKQPPPRTRVRFSPSPASRDEGHFRYCDRRRLGGHGRCDAGECGNDLADGFGGGDGLQRRGEDALDHVQRRLLLDAVVGEQFVVLQLAAGEEEALLRGEQAFLVVELLLDLQDRVGGRGVDGDGLARHALDEDLHGCGELWEGAPECCAVVASSWVSAICGASVNGGSDRLWSVSVELEV